MPIARIKRPASLVLVAAVFGLPFAGCASSGRNYDATQVSSIKKGQTTEADLIQTFGEPQERATDAEGNQRLIWSYTHVHANGASYIPIYGAFAGGSEGTTKTLTVTVKDGVVTDYQSTEGATGARRGN